MRTDHYVLLVDDDLMHAIALQEALLAAGHDPARFEWVRTLSRALERVARGSAACVFLSLRLPDSQGLATVETFLPLVPGTQVVVIGGVGDDDLCESALLFGASDFLPDGDIDSHAFARAIRNVTEREVARRSLLSEQERARVILDSIGDAVLSVDLFGEVTYLNSVAEQMTGWPSWEAVGQPLTAVFRIVDSLTRQAARDPLELAIRLDKPVDSSVPCSLIRRDGHESVIEESAAPLHDRDGQIMGAVVVFHHASQVQNVVLEASQLAQVDALTGLPNRLLLKERLTQSLLLARRSHGHLAVLFLNLDGFTRVNDTLGHTVGDEVLQSVAARLSDCVRKSDTVSRLGGDEFVILLPAIVREADALITATKLLAELRRPHAAGGHLVPVTASIGVCTYPECGDDADALIAQADAAMSRAKDCGRDNAQCFHPATSAHARERQSLEQQLRCALDERGLVLHYQPKVNLRTGAITSAEALVRWRHPEFGLLLPAAFLGLAETNGMMVAIDRWVMREACRQTQAWIDAGVQAVPVSVNVSSLESQGSQFLDSVRDALAEASLDPRFLEVELTENILLRDSPATRTALEGVRALGVRLAIDDFGRGYSSLSHFARFPVDTLKLDPSFVRNVGSSSEDAVVVGAVIHMARGLKHRVVAEGVETSEQLAFFQAQQCDEGQGYYFSRPIAGPQFADLLSSFSHTV